MTNDIIVLIPGIGGSRLERDGKAIYDLSLPALPRLIWNWVGADLALRGGDGKPDDGVVATDLFNNQLIPGWFGVDDYDGLIATLRSVVREPARQVVKFPYDWRASNKWAALALDAKVRPLLHDWRNGPGGADAKLWLVCHSMGGLVARYFLEHLGGAEITRRLVTIATPHRGALKAVGAMVNGMRFGPLDFSAVIRSFASTYELLPQAPVITVNAPYGERQARVADFFGMGDLLPLPPGATPSGPLPLLHALPHIDPERLRSALEFHRAIREPVTRRMQMSEPTPYAITCLFNRRQRTPQSARWLAGELSIFDDSPFPIPTSESALFHRGDGTVPGPSAVPIEWAQTEDAIALDEKHVAMPSSRVLTNVLQNLASPLNTRAYMSGHPSDGSLGLSAPAVVMAGDPFEIELDVVRAARLTVTAKLLQSSDMRSHESVISLKDGATEHLALSLSEPGTYKVTAKSADPLRPVVSEWVVVAARS